MFLFKTKRKEKEPPAWMVKAVGKERAVRMQIAAWLSQATAHIPRRRLQWFCFCFVLIGLLGNTWILVQAINQPEKAAFTPKMSSPLILDQARKVMTAPVMPDTISFRRLLRSFEADPDFRPQLHAMLRMVDSVSRDPLVKAQLDDLIRSRPGFADSLRAMQEMFQQQK
jgi:hypothetical protein